MNRPRFTKLKSATKLALFSTMMIIGAMVLLFLSLSFAFDSRMRHIQKNVLEGGAQFIADQIQKGVPYADIQYPNTYFIVYDQAKNMQYDGSGGQKIDKQTGIQYKDVEDGVYNIEVFCTIALTDQTATDFVMIALFLIMVAVVCFVISVLIIDKVLNPVRVMIEKVKSISNQNFNSKIFIDSAEDELREYAYAFNQMSSKISAYIDNQKQFISDASHELVTPITVIVGHTDMLMRWGKDDAETLHAGLGTIKEEALSMNELIENLLFFSRTDNKMMQYDMKRFHLTSLIEECVSEQKMLHAEFDIAYESTEPIEIVADYNAIKQVIRIVFANSVKYSEHKKQIVVTVETEAQYANLSISDKGLGIEQEYLEKIFNRFFRIDDSRTRQTGGTGLGLAIAKEIIEAHGYTISAQSKPGEGTTIHIRMKTV